MRFIALVISLFVILSLPALATATEETPAPSPTPVAAATTPDPVAASTPNPMDPRFEVFYPRNEVEAEQRNPGGEWRRGEYGKMQYTPPVRKHAATTTDTTTTTNTTTRPIGTDTTRVMVTVNVGVAPEGDIPPPGATTTTAAPKKGKGGVTISFAPNWWGILGSILLLALIALVVWAVWRTWGIRAGATTGVAVAIFVTLVWLALG